MPTIITIIQEKYPSIRDFVLELKQSLNARLCKSNSNGSCKGKFK